MTNCIGAVYIKSDTEQLWSIKSGGVCDKKNKINKDVTNCTCVVYVENDTEMS